MGCNSRLDTIQAVVGNWLLPQTEWIAETRIKNAHYYDTKFSKIKQIKLPPRPKNLRIVYHLYIVFASDRDGLLEFCIGKGIEAKVHYPTPIYRQTALNKLGYKKGDFPVTDKHCRNIITFPCDQHMSMEQLDYVAETVKNYYY